jgi:N-methylhydantoinase A
MRYRGQSYEIETVLAPEEIAEGRIAAIADAFHRAHERIYEHCDRQAPIQVINLRMVIIGASPKPEFPKRSAVGGRARPAREIAVYLDGRRTRIPLYLREHLEPDQTFEGPAVVAQADCTTCIPGGFSGSVDAYGHLILKLAR